MDHANEEQQRCLLPVFYFNLDPQDAPNENEFDPDTLPPAKKGAIARARSALSSLARVVNFPRGLGAELWPRLWPWARFFHFFHEHLPGLLLPDAEASICFDLVMSAGAFQFHPPSYDLIKSTPGFWFMLGRAWFHATQDVQPSRQHILFALSGLLAKPDVGDPTHLAQVMEGVGGSFHDLARTAKRYLVALVPIPPAVMDMVSVHTILNFLGFLRIIDPSLNDPIGGGPPLGAFGSTLVSYGIVRVLTDTVCAATSWLRQQQDEEPLETSYLKQLVGHTFAALALLVTKSPRDGKLTVALKSRLLTALVLAAQIPNTAAYEEIIQYWTGALPRYLVRYRVVRALGSALDGVADLASTDAFRHCPAYDNWTTFVSVAQERIRLLESLSLPAAVPLRACDNIQCLRMHPRSSLRRCSGCSSLYYCSKPCQMTDRREGGHRNTCKFYGILCLRADGPSGLSAQDRAYLRALADHDYQKARSTLAYDELLFRHANPGEPHFVIYDYTQAIGTITVYPLTTGIGPSLFPHVEGVDIISRVMRSGGRMRLDMLFLPNGLGRQSCIIPLRRNRPSRLDEGIGLLARELPRDHATWDVGSVKARLTAMLDDPGLVEIH
ncbi:hypothetical protein C8R46DRAFT_269178 [Mycena filopes]|nr:hypothetical protein C8R46DRAFT_269178 [Mycena filopes]